MKNASGDNLAFSDEDYASDGNNKDNSGNQNTLFHKLF
jgi:hypothetical protein